MSICMNDIWMQTSHEGRTHTMEDWETCHNPSWSGIRREPGQPSLAAEPSVPAVLLCSHTLKLRFALESFWNCWRAFRFLPTKDASTMSQVEYSMQHPTLKVHSLFYFLSRIMSTHVVQSDSRTLWNEHRDWINIKMSQIWTVWNSFFFYYSTSPQTKSPCK